MQGLWLDWFAGCFARVEVRRTARSYVEGLLSSIGRKNCWWLAQQAGHVDPGRMQRLLAGARWDAEALRDVLLRVVAALLGTADGVLIVDETGFAKKGTASVGVARQYSGTLGKVDNCQVAVFLAYATSRVRLLVDRILYLPKSWTDDPQRCAKAGVPAGTGFATKAQLALAMIRRALAAGLQAQWLAADEAYGRDSRFRAALRGLHLAYVVAVPRDQHVHSSGQRYRVDVLTAMLPTRAWQTYSCGLGSKGPRLYRWAWVHIDGPAGCHSLLVRRSSDNTLAFYLTWTAQPVALPTLVAVAGRRWCIEEGFQVSKDAFGLDQYQTRSWDGWHRHTTLAILALGLTVLATHDDQAAPATEHDIAASTNPIPVTINEARHLIAALIISARHASRSLIDHILNWSNWRRQHQATARAAHYRQRLAIQNC
jgi:SRSO17 transposase